MGTFQPKHLTHIALSFETIIVKIFLQENREKVRLLPNRANRRPRLYKQYGVSNFVSSLSIHNPVR